MPPSVLPVKAIISTSFWRAKNQEVGKPKEKERQTFHVYTGGLCKDGFCGLAERY
jgi:hypothetical protein